MGVKEVVSGIIIPAVPKLFLSNIRRLTIIVSKIDQPGARSSAIENE